MSAEPTAYLDSSAFVKLFSVEAETRAMRAYLGEWPRLVSSALLRVEALRTARKLGLEQLTEAQLWLRRVGLIPITNVIFDNAALMEPGVLRALDAIHIATAMRLGPDVGVIVTYDRRMAEAARLMGYQVAAPA